MAKLNPPHLESTLPAFYIDEASPSITIPFGLNRSVGMSQITQMQILIKTVQTNVEVYNGKTNAIDFVNCTVTYQLALDTFTPQVGQYYKIQLAFINSGEVGYYSSVGVIKCTAKPNIYIETLDNAKTNNNKYTYTGVYENSDTNEKVYNYCFNIYDELGNLYETSGELIHNSSKDKQLNSSNDTWSPTKGLIPGKDYSIEYCIKTLNGLEIKTEPQYTIANNFLINPPDWFDGELHATLYQDDGYIELSLHGAVLYGKFILSRTSSKENFETWHKITEFTIADAPNGLVLWRDFTIEQGVEYLYSIQMFNDNICTIQLVNREHKIMADFEDMFLSDGKRQLKIRFNPKVSSFKNNRLEAKIDTIGGQFPHFFRNGSVSYKEFPISGLISMLMDDNKFFAVGLKSTHEFRQNTPSKDYNVTVGRTQLITENIHDERNFKLEVLEWLQNGEFKLFRSPGEGNYIVRLLNISASPNDTLGRMIHTFNSTAYEALECTFENLKAQGYLNIDESIDLSSYHITSTLDVFNFPYEGLTITGNKIESVDKRLMHNIIITNAAPNAKVLVSTANTSDTQVADSYGTLKVTGSWTAFEFIGIFDDGGGDYEDLVSIHTAVVDFDFIEDLANYKNWKNFNKLKTVKLADTPIQQCLNLYSTAVFESSCVNDDRTINYLKYLDKYFSEVGEVYYIYLRKRDLGTNIIASEISYKINISSHNQNLTPTVINEGWIYRDCGVLSELTCGNGFDIDIVFLRKIVS